MSEDTNVIVGSLGRELVSDLAPEELPLYPSLLSQFQGAKRGRGKLRQMISSSASGPPKQ